jgi:L-ascorbate metabolism protein UlaG (beta-lactamase superfamily)
VAVTRTRRILATLGGLLIALFTVGFLATLAPSFGAKPASTRLERMEASPRWDADGSKFKNPVATMDGRMDMWGMVKAYATNKAEVEPSVDLPLVTPGDLAAQGSDRLRITWMGHSSMLIEIDGKLVLTDPVWGPRAAPFSFLGPARFHAPPVPVEQLPKLDAILISHDHYDHLDHPTVLALKDRDVPWYVPLGLGAHLESWGVPAERIHEMDWWDTAEVGDVQLVSTPARHFSGRGLGDRDHTLWTSWAVVGPKHRVWYSGDTGPAEFFTEIGEKLGPFDATMIEVGAWNAMWGDVHLGSEGAVGVHKQVRGDVMIPVHWGTFNLALHAWDAPIIELIAHTSAADVSLAAPLVGGTIDPEWPAVDAFWQDRARLSTPASVSANTLSPALSEG